MPTALRAAVVLGVLFTLTSSCALVERDVVIWKVGSPLAVPSFRHVTCLKHYAASRRVDTWNW